MYDSLLIGAGILLIVTGIIGAVLPIMPGPPFVFMGLGLIAWTDDFSRTGVGTFVVIGLLGLFSLIVDLLASTFGAKRAGASTAAIIGAAIGLIVGAFFSIPGIIIGPFVGAFAGEYFSSRHFGTAGRVGLATWAGLIFGAFVKVGVCLAMVGVFAWSWYL